MPKVKVTELCHVIVSPVVTTTYSPCDEVLAPDAHIDEIERQGKGERLTERGDVFGQLDTSKVGDAAS